MRLILCLIFAFMLIDPSYANNLDSGEFLITDFEKTPFNNFGGTMGVFGAMSGSGRSTEYSHSGSYSYKLIFSKEAPPESEHYVEYKRDIHNMKKAKTIATPRKFKNITWAVFLLYAGPFIDTTTVPIKIKSVDLSKYKYIVFWVKGKRGGEDFRVYFRDANATDYTPQLKIKPKVVVKTKWEPVEIDIGNLKDKVDITKIDEIGISFGKEDGNRQGNTLYVDDFILKQ